MNALCFGQPTSGLGTLLLSPPGFTGGYPRGQPFGLCYMVSQDGIHADVLRNVVCESFFTIAGAGIHDVTFAKRRTKEAQGAQRMIVYSRGTNARVLFVPIFCSGASNGSKQQRRASVKVPCVALYSVAVVYLLSSMGSTICWPFRSMVICVFSPGLNLPNASI